MEILEKVSGLCPYIMHLLDFSISVQLATE
jgi:hypothetical protein